MQRLFDIAPPVTWIRVLLAALLIVLGVVAYGQTRLRSQGFGEPFRGWTAPDRTSMWARWTVVFTATGLALWGNALGWRPVVLAVPVVAALAGLAAEVAVRVRRRG